MNSRLPENLFKKGSLVEVSSDEEGFSDAWYVATVALPPYKNSRKGKILVSYKTLLGSKRKKLREIVDISHLRPLPPPQNPETLFEIGDVVDAFYRDGWWIGEVVKAFGEKDKFLVEFQDPHDEMEFSKDKLRLHLDWIGGNWVRPEKKTTVGMTFSEQMATEVKLEKEKGRDVWFPATVLRETGAYLFLAKYKSSRYDGGAESLTVAVDSLHIRPSPPILEDKDFGLMEKVDAYYDFGWWSGVITKLLTHRRYMVYFKHDKSAKEFNHTELRPNMEWIDGNWTKLSQSQEKPMTSQNQGQFGNSPSNVNGTSSERDAQAEGSSIGKGNYRRHGSTMENHTELPKSRDRGSTSRVKVLYKIRAKRTTTPRSARGKKSNQSIPTVIGDAENEFATAKTMGDGETNFSEPPVIPDESNSNGTLVDGVVEAGGGDNGKPMPKKRGRKPSLLSKGPKAEAEKGSNVGSKSIQKDAETPVTTGLEFDQAENPGVILSDKSIKLIVRGQKKLLNAAAKDKSMGTRKIKSSGKRGRGRPSRFVYKSKKSSTSGNDGGSPYVVIIESSGASQSQEDNPGQEQATEKVNLADIPMAKQQGDPIKGTQKRKRGRPHKFLAKRQKTSASGTKVENLSTASVDSKARMGLESENTSEFPSQEKPKLYKDQFNLLSEERHSEIVNNMLQMPVSEIGKPLEMLLKEHLPKRGSRNITITSRAQTQVSQDPVEERGEANATADQMVAEEADKVVVEPDPTNSEDAPLCTWFQEVQPVPVANGDASAEPGMSLNGTINPCTTAVIEGMSSVPDQDPVLPSDSFAERDPASGADQEQPVLPVDIVAHQDPDQASPFVKSSPLWRSIESQEMYRRFPQNPCFSTLEREKEEFREGLAIGYTVTFYNLVEKVSTLQLDDPPSLFYSYLEALLDLEIHGFIVAPQKGVIHNLLSIKDGREELQGKFREADIQLSQSKTNALQIDEDIARMTEALRRLEEKRAEEDSQIVALQTDLDSIHERIASAEHHFNEVKLGLSIR